MQPSTYLYAHHSPDKLLEVEIQGTTGRNSWIHVHPPEPDESTFTLGLSVTQARALARDLFRAAAGIEAQQAEDAAKLPAEAPTL